MSDNKRIAKNTLFLYFRMILIMGVTLYMSRVVLDKLGVDDYGLYNVVGGVVGMLSFLNGTLSTGTSRFLTFELGVGDAEKLQKTFSTAFYTHVLLSLIILLVMETGGVWFLYNKLVIPPNRLNACFWVLQLSIITTIISIIRVPYTSAIIAHEQMSVYAYISIFEAFAKLGICYLLSITSFDRLVFYAMLIGVVQITVSLLYVIYCRWHYKESVLLFTLDKGILNKMLGFSGWNIMANLSEVLGQQGLLVLINLFFTSVVVSAQAIAVQVSTAMMQFVHNFRTAINPQIIKQFAAGDVEASKKLTLETTVYCFDLVLFLGLPSIILMDKFIHLWLVEVPDYAVVFTQWIIVRCIVGTFSLSFYVPMIAANKMKVNSMAAVFFGFGEFLLLYVLFKLGFGPMWIQYLGIALAMCFSLIVKPYVLIKEIGYTLQEMLICYFTCIKVLFFSCFIAIPFAFILNDSIPHSLLKAFVSAVGVAIASYVFMSVEMRVKLNQMLKRKLLHANY